jgi:putative DNA primase/helicase
MADGHDQPTKWDIVREFEDAMQRAGFIVPGGVIADTADFQRIDAPGDKKGRQNGFYKLLTNGAWPVGWFGDWKDAGNVTQWAHRSKDTLTKSERETIKREHARLKADEAAARAVRAAEVAEDASKFWKAASTDATQHPYVERKEITARGVRIHTASEGTELLAVPMWAFDEDGNPGLISLQMIGPDGSKRFLKAGRVDGCFFSIKGQADLVVICEGYATAASIWEATGFSVVAAFNAGNLANVAREFKRHRPGATLLIAGDDDQHVPADWKERGKGKPWVNAGRLKTEAAAKAVGARWLLPSFPTEEGRPTDFNDLHRMCGLGEVKAQIAGALRDTDEMNPYDDDGEAVARVEAAFDESWRKKVRLNGSGNPDGANVENVALYLTHYRLLKNRLAFNRFSQEIEVDGASMEDHHAAEFRRIMHADEFKAKKPDVYDEMMAIARRNSFDPLLDYLAGLRWDGVPRLGTWLARYAGAEASEYTAEVGRSFLIGAVARARVSGCKMDTMLILEGAQGLGKSTLLRYLFGDRFFVDHLPDFNNKDSFQQLQGAWCVEVAELGAMAKAEVKDIKQFMSRLVDKFRPPFARVPVQLGRRVVFAGSVNPEEGGYLKDQTGNRRFWPVMCRAVDLAGILNDRNQLWAEAVMEFEHGTPWHLTDEGVIAAAQHQQELRREIHPWETLIRVHLQNQWEVSVSDIIANVLKLPADRQSSQTVRQVAAALNACGWVPGNDRGAEKIWKKPL